MKYYILDYGKETTWIAESIMEQLKDKGHHTLIYLTDLDNSFMVTEVTEDEFLDHYSVMLED